MLFDRLIVALQLESSLASSQATGAQSSKFGLNLVLFERNVMGLVLLWPEVGYGEALFEVCAKVVHPADGEHDVHAELGGALVDEALEGSHKRHLEDFEIGASHDCGIEWMVVFGCRRWKWSIWNQDGRRDECMIQSTWIRLSHAKCLRKLRPRYGTPETSTFTGN
jgi:hypothetical protein